MAYFLILLLTPSAVLIAGRIEHKGALPLLTTISVYFPFLLEVQYSLWRGMALLLFWTALQSVLILYLSDRDPSGMAVRIWKAEGYTETMMRWIDSGKLPEGSAPNVVLFHLKQTLLYCAFAFLSADFLSLMLGSALLNYMNYYVAQLSRHSKHRRLAMLLGWNPWSVLRVVSFLYLGILFAAPALSLFLPLRFSLSIWALIPGVIGIILDIMMKLMLSRSWSQLLGRYRQ